MGIHTLTRLFNDFIVCLCLCILITLTLDSAMIPDASHHCHRCMIWRMARQTTSVAALNATKSHAATRVAPDPCEDCAYDDRRGPQQIRSVAFAVLESLTSSIPGLATGHIRRISDELYGKAESSLAQPNTWLFSGLHIMSLNGLTLLQMLQRHR